LLKLFHSLDLKLKSCLIALFGSAFLAFGLYHVHSFSGVTEGGVLGMTLLLDHWFHISPSVSGFIMNLACYAMGWKLLGRQFIAYSILSSASFSLSYRICEQFPPLWPQLADMPLAASLLGAVFVGVGAGLCVRIGGAPGGDDALAMSLSHVTHIKIQWIYLLSDFAVLVLSHSVKPHGIFHPHGTPVRTDHRVCADRGNTSSGKYGNLIVFIRFSRFQTCLPVNSNEFSIFFDFF
jgi:uncharacterized membrane-anchored protein YitT (DUF2179 family)